MAKRTGPTNPELQKEILRLRSKKAAIWRRVAEDLKRPTRTRRRVNLSRINRHVKDGEVIVVPGKVLAAGKLEKKIKIAAWQFSNAAKEKIIAAGGKIFSLTELADQNPKGSGVKIIG